MKLLCLFLLILCSEGKVSAMSINEEGSWVFEVFCQQLAKKYNMECLITGVGTVVDSRVVAWDVSLVDHRSLTIEQARPIIFAMIQDMLRETNSKPIYKAYLKDVAKSLRWYDPVLSPKRFGIKLAFWDKDVNRPRPPYLSQIKVSEGLIYYFYANPDQSLGTPIIETFDQAATLIK